MAGAKKGSQCGGGCKALSREEWLAELEILNLDSDGTWEDSEGLFSGKGITLDLSGLRGEPRVLGKNYMEADYG